MTVSSLRIGIETEVLLRAHDIQDQCKGTIEEFAEGLVRYYNTKIEEIHGQTALRFESDHWHASDNEENFRCWSVVVEASIDPDTDDCKHSAILLFPSRANVSAGGLEFASPIINYEPGSPWRQNLRSHFQILESYATIMSDVTCGTHVHVSPADSKWTLEQVKNVSRSILYFEEAFEVLLPPERRGNQECRSNRVENPKLKSLPDLESCCEMIQECATVKALVHLMNAKEEDLDNVCEESNGERAVTERRYGFNFENLLDGGIGTIGMHCYFRGKAPLDGH